MPYKNIDKQRDFQRKWAVEKRATFLRSVGCQLCGESTEPMSCVRVKRGVPKPFYGCKNPVLDGYIVLCSNCAKDRNDLLSNFRRGGPRQRRLIEHWRDESMKFEFIEPRLRSSLLALEKKGMIEATEQGFELTERGKRAAFYLRGNRRLLAI